MPVLLASYEHTALERAGLFNEIPEFDKVIDVKFHIGKDLVPAALRGVSRHRPGDHFLDFDTVLGRQDYIELLDHIRDDVVVEPLARFLNSQLVFAIEIAANQVHDLPTKHFLDDNGICWLFE